MSPNCKFSLPVFVVASAITYIYFSTVFIFIDMWFGLTTSPGILNAIAFTAVAFMCVLNYVVAILTDPGRVPATFMPDIEDSQSPIHEIKRKVIRVCFLFLMHACLVFFVCFLALGFLWCLVFEKLGIVSQIVVLAQCFVFCLAILLVWCK